MEEVPEQQVKTAIFGHGMGRVELISPTTPDSGVARFLASRGEGLHHVCIEVEDIEAAMDSLRKAGAPLIDQEPRPGAGGARVAFVHPRGMRGVLTEHDHVCDSKIKVHTATLGHAGLTYLDRLG